MKLQLIAGRGLCCAAAIFFSTAANALDPADKVLESSRATVTAEDIDRYILENLPKDGSERAAVLRNPNVYREMAESLYVMRALAGEAESAPAYNEAQARWAAEMAYQRRLVSRYRQSFIRHALKDIDWESSAKEEYRANAARYMRPDLVKASHILIKVEERSEREALDLIESLHGKLLEGTDFAALAREFSEDSSAQGGGNLGYFKYGTMDPAFESAVFELQENGDISKPVRSQFGYHIIMLTGRKEGQKIPYDEVKADIIDGLQTKMGDRLWQEKIVRLRSSPDIVYDPRTLTGLRQKYDKPAPGGNGK